MPGKSGEDGVHRDIEENLHGRGQNRYQTSHDFRHRPCDVTTLATVDGETENSPKALGTTDTRKDGTDQVTLGDDSRGPPAFVRVRRRKTRSETRIPVRKYGQNRVENRTYDIGEPLPFLLLDSSATNGLGKEMDHDQLLDPFGPGRKRDLDGRLSVETGSTENATHPFEFSRAIRWSSEIDRSPPDMVAIDDRSGFDVDVDRSVRPSVEEDSHGEDGHTALRIRSVRYLPYPVIMSPGRVKPTRHNPGG